MKNILPNGIFIINCEKYSLDNIINGSCLYLIDNNKINDTIQNILLNNSNTTENIKYDKVLDTIEEIFTSPDYNTYDLDNWKNEIIKTEKMIITFTTTQNQIKNKDDNETRIDLGECEFLLRKYYHIPNDELIYMKKIDIKRRNEYSKNRI